MSAPMTRGPGEGMELRWALLVQEGESAVICVGIPGRGILQSCLMPARGGCCGEHTGGRGGHGLLCHGGNSIGEGLSTKCM